jgi:hypothetical protein
MEKTDRKMSNIDDAELLKPIASADDRTFEECIAPQTAEASPPPQGRVGIARGRYCMMPDFDDPLPEFEGYA